VSDEKFPVLNFHEFIAADGDRTTTDSRKVAAVFGKLHGNVLRDIDKILAQVPDSFGKLNFEAAEYLVTNNLGFAVKERMFVMTKDGFLLLAMGFTGKKALQFKLAYIRAFNDMAAYIKNEREGLQMRYFEKALEHKHKKDRASFHGRGLNEWRQEKPALETELSKMLEEMQPGLQFGGLLN
jgi:Rha family phage regulatory protein